MSSKPTQQPQTQQFQFKEILPAYRSGQINRDQAHTLYQKFLAIEACRPKAFNMLGLLAMEQSRYIDAVGLLSQAIAHAPEQPEYHHNLATNLRILGNFEDAEHHYVRALTLRPSYAEAYFNFSDIRRFHADDDFVKLLEAQLATVDQRSPDDQCFLHFAAGKIYQDLKNYPRAFHHFQSGNKARHATFDRTQHDAWIDQLITVCDRAFFDTQLGQSQVTASPIFVVGMPRSGTTLTESILTQHPMVGGLGELPDIRCIAQTLPSHINDTPYPDCLRAASPTMLDGFAKSYLKRTHELAPKATPTVDKMPSNFFHLGLIALLFPNAKIIHCQRHPLDTCLSCYCKNFRNGQEFSFDLEDLGHFYLAYERLMRHWEAVLPLPIFQMKYEQVVQNQEQVSRDLLAFCGLPWDDKCLAFNKSDRPVRTASTWQVRQPLYSSSVNRWKRYEHELAPLRAILNC